MAGTAVLPMLMLCCATALQSQDSALGSSAQKTPHSKTGSPSPQSNTAPSVQRSTEARKQHCQPNGGFCFKYPASWIELGEIFNGNGVVVAPPQKQDKTLWNAITVALVIPAPEAGDESMTLDDAVEEATAGLRDAGQDFETLQRQGRTIDHKPAQMLKVRYHQNSPAADWVEELVFIQGPKNEIYTVALKSSPAELARFENPFTAVLESCTLPETAPTPITSSEPQDAAPQQGTTPP